MHFKKIMKKHFTERPGDSQIVGNLGRKVAEGCLKPSSDTSTHLELYRHFSKIGGITHTHSRWAAVFSQSAMRIPALGATHADSFCGDITCTRGMTDDEIFGQYELETGRGIAELFNENRITQVPGVLVRSHGPFTWGKNAMQSVERAVVLEEIAMMAWHTLMLKPDAQFQQALLDKHYLRKHGENAYYGQ